MKLLSVEETAEFLDMHPETIRKMSRERRLPAIKVGRSWKFKEDDLLQWLEEQKQQ